MSFKTTNNNKTATGDATGEARLEHLACLMTTNSVRQHEFAVVLRRLGARLDVSSPKRNVIHTAYRTARNKESRLRNMVDELGFEPRKPQDRNPRFLLYFGLAEWAPIKLMTILLSIGISKRIRAHLLDGVSHKPRRRSFSQFAY